MCKTSPVISSRKPHHFDAPLTKEPPSPGLQRLVFTLGPGNAAKRRAILNYNTSLQDVSDVTLAVTSQLPTNEDYLEYIHWNKNKISAREKRHEKCVLRKALNLAFGFMKKPIIWYLEDTYQLSLKGRYIPA